MHKPGLDGTEERTRIIASLFTGKEGVPCAFAPAELGELLAHQLRSNILAALAEEQGAATRMLSLIATALKGAKLSTFAELFDHPQPPETALSAVRAYVKRLTESAADGVPIEGARVLEVLGEPRAHHSSREIRSGIAATRTSSHLARWCLAQTWLDEPTRERIRQRLG